MTDSRLHASLPAAALGLALLLFATMLFKHASYPLLRDAEASTAMFGTRILEYGYPKVHGVRAAIYPSALELEDGIAADLDAFRGGLWGSYYAAALAELFARGAEDPWARTGRLRVLFSLFASGGVAFLLAALVPLMGGPAARSFGAAAYLLLLAACVPFLLHVREVGPLAPTLLFLGAVVYRVLRVERGRIEGARAPDAGRHALVLVPLLLALGATSTPISLAVFATLLLRGLYRALRRAPRALAVDLLPLCITALLLYPMLAYLGPAGLRWDVLGLVGTRDEAPSAPLADVLVYLFRHQWLLPVVLARIAILVLGRVHSHSTSLQAARLGAAWLLSLLVAAHVSVLAALPIFLERHAVLLAPLLTALLLLDLRSMLAWAGHRQGVPRRLGFASAAGVALAWLIAAALQGSEIAGRIHEITHRYRGPLDHIVTYLREEYEDPSELVIATNYEGAALRYYLGSIVLVDTFPSRLAQDYLLQPDIILPRPSARSQRHLGHLSLGGAYDQNDLAVINLLANNVPTLSKRDAGEVLHRFETADLPEGTAGVPVLELPR